MIPMMEEIHGRPKTKMLMVLFSGSGILFYFLLHHCRCVQQIAIVIIFIIGKKYLKKPGWENWDLHVGLPYEPAVVCVWGRGRGRSLSAHSLRIVLEVLRFCQLVVLSCCILAGQDELFGRHHNLQREAEKFASEWASELQDIHSTKYSTALHWPKHTEDSSFKKYTILLHYLYSVWKHTV